MTFEEYQEKSRVTAIYPDAGRNMVYPTLGLVSEAGEVASKLKKAIRDQQGVIDDERRAAMEQELGDVLWYVSQIVSELNLNLETVAEKNIEKLYSRKDRGVLSGDGDNR